MRFRLVLPLLLLLVSLPHAHADAQLDAHLLTGVRAFRQHDYATALVEFHQAERAGSVPDLALYLGPTLYKLGRLDEARVVLGRLRRGGGHVDAVADYYLGLTYYRAGLLRLAHAIFAGLDPADAGPKLAAGAARMMATIDGDPALTADAATPLAAAAALAPAHPELALDEAEEAFLRAPTGSVEHTRAAALVSRLAGPAEAADRVARDAHRELTEPARR